MPIDQISLKNTSDGEVGDISLIVYCPRARTNDKKAILEDDLSDVTTKIHRPGPIRGQWLAGEPAYVISPVSGSDRNANCLMRAI